MEVGVCRHCSFRKGENPLFSEEPCGLSLASKIMECFNLKMVNSPLLPHSYCNICYERISDSLKLREEALKREQKYNQFISEAKEQSEPQPSPKSPLEPTVEPSYSPSSSICSPQSSLNNSNKHGYFRSPFFICKCGMRFLEQTKYDAHTMTHDIETTVHSEDLNANKVTSTSSPKTQSHLEIEAIAQSINFSCDICTEVFASEQLLLNHLVTHTSPLHPGVKFDEVVAALREHSLNTGSEGSLTRTVSQESVTSSVLSALSISHDSSGLVCHCGMKFLSYDLYQSHLEKRHNEKSSSSTPICSSESSENLSSALSSSSCSKSSSRLTLLDMMAKSRASKSPPQISVSPQTTSESGITSPTGQPRHSCSRPPMGLLERMKDFKEITSPPRAPAVDYSVTFFPPSGKDLPKPKPKDKTPIMLLPAGMQGFTDNQIILSACELPKSLLDLDDSEPSKAKKKSNKKSSQPQRKSPSPYFHQELSNDETKNISRLSQSLHDKAVPDQEIPFIGVETEGFGRNFGYEPWD